MTLWTAGLCSPLTRLHDPLDRLSVQSFNQSVGGGGGGHRYPRPPPQRPPQRPLWTMGPPVGGGDVVSGGLGPSGPGQGGGCWRLGGRLGWPRHRIVFDEGLGPAGGGGSGGIVSGGRSIGRGGGVGLAQ